MTVVYAALFLIVILSISLIIDRKIKGSKSIIAKVFYLGFFTLLIVGSVYFYGATFFEAFRVDLRSFTKIKEFFSSRIVAILLMLLMILFVFIKTIYFAVSFRTNKMVLLTKKETAIILLSVVFDIAVIPNIVIAGSFNILLVVPAIISIVETGLSLLKVVFSIFYTPKLEGAMC